jgi:hypothetical protein
MVPVLLCWQLRRSTIECDPTIYRRTEQTRLALSFPGLNAGVCRARRVLMRAPLFGYPVKLARIRDSFRLLPELLGWLLSRGIVRVCWWREARMTKLYVVIEPRHFELFRNKFNVIDCRLCKLHV